MLQMTRERMSAWVAVGAVFAMVGVSPAAMAQEAAPASTAGPDTTVGAPAAAGGDAASVAPGPGAAVAAPASTSDAPASTTTAAAGPDVLAPAAAPSDVKTEIPNLVYAYQASGVTAKTMGVQVYGLGLVGRGDGQKAIAGGGASVWGSPVDRLTLIGDASRDQFGNFAPSAAAVVRLVGRANDGWSLGALGKFKVEGFATGPNNEFESEVESGLLLSYAKYGWHLDANAITGFGLGDDGEIDVEGRLRLGRDLGEIVRVGLDGQFRVRAAGDNKLVGGRTADFAGGPQVLIGSSHFFGALTAGPATMGVYSDVGFTAVAYRRLHALGRVQVARGTRSRRSPRRRIGRHPRRWRANPVM